MDALLEEMPASALQEWLAYDELEPIGPLRGDIQTAWTIQHLISPYLKRGSKPQLSDYLPPYCQVAKPKQQRQSADQIKGAFAAVRARMKR